MTWDKRNRKYYRTRRRAHKVVREYFGAGHAARLAAALDDHRREQKQQDRTTTADVRRQWKEACEPLDRLRADTRLLLQAVRLTRQRPVVEEGEGVMIETGNFVDELRRLAAEAASGDAAVLPRAQQLLDRHASGRWKHPIGASRSALQVARLADIIRLLQRHRFSRPPSQPRLEARCGQSDCKISGADPPFFGTVGVTNPQIC